MRILTMAHTDNSYANSAVTFRTIRAADSFCKAGSLYEERGVAFVQFRPAVKLGRLSMRIKSPTLPCLVSPQHFHFPNTQQLSLVEVKVDRNLTRRHSYAPYNNCN